MDAFAGEPAFDCDTLNCDDDNICTIDTCSPDLGCIFNPGPENNSPCDDGDACTDADTCQDGICVGPPNPLCEEQVAGELLPLDSSALMIAGLTSMSVWMMVLKAVMKHLV